jgi:hypothetical protein
VTLEQIRAEVFAHRRLFGEVAHAWRDVTCLEYASQNFPNLLTPTDTVLSAIEQETTMLLGPSAGRHARASLEEQRWVSTADHHGLLNHPYFYTAALLRSHHKVRPLGNTTVVLAFGNVSLSNDSFPRGFFFHDAHFREARFHLKSLHERRMPVFGLPPVLKGAFVKECERSMHQPLASRARERIALFLERIAESDTVWSQETYGAQLTILNAVWWKTLFGEARGELVYLEIESVVRRLLLEQHLITETPLHKIFFDAQWRSRYLTLFEGIFGAHGENFGTHFFWYADRVKNMRRQLFVRGDIMETANGDVSISLTPDAVREKIVSRELVPGTALNLITVHAEGLLASAGGLSQIEYLKTMSERWNKLLGSFGEAHALPNPSIFCGEQALFGLCTEDGRVSLASLMDLYLYMEDDRNTAIDHAIEEAPFYGTLDAMMPTLYWLLTRERTLHSLAHAPRLIPHHA